MNITKKHYLLIFLLLLLIVVLIRNYATSGKSKPLPTAPNREETVEIDASSAKFQKQEVESKEIFSFLGERKETDRKAPTRKDPFMPILQHPVKSDQPTDELENYEYEEATHNKIWPNSVRLVGVIVDDTPLAILEVDNTSYIVSIGDIAAGMKVAAIRGDEIVLILENGERTIKLDEE